MTEEELRGIAVDEGSYVFADEFWEDILTATNKGIMNEALDRIEKVIPHLEKMREQHHPSFVTRIQSPRAEASQHI